MPFTRAHAARLAARGFASATLILVLALGCQATPASTPSFSTAPNLHTWFAIGAGTPHTIGEVKADGTTMGCQSCHPSNTTSFAQINCVNCHGHEEAVTARLHLTVAQYRFDDSKGCYTCHPSDKKIAFDHAAISDNCAMCHDIAAPFAVLPRAGFTHPAKGTLDCAGCHNTTDWAGATGAATAHDPSHDILVAALVPTFGGTTMVNLTAQTQTLPMIMNHGSIDAPAAVMSDCTSCHLNATTTGYFPGVFHASLAALGIAQPTACASCHLNSAPAGFVGPLATNPARVPSSGEMRHDAVAWANDAATSTRLVTTNCGSCHRVPNGPGTTATSWASGKSTATVQFHAALSAAALPPPTSCLDCHANARPRAPLTSANATLPAGTTFDHGATGARGDCAACHAAATQSWTSWRAGQFHLPGSATPATCLPCHAGERPTSTASWTSPTYQASPFDYVNTSAGSTHGDGQDCALCHGNPGTGSWGGGQNWAAGHFNHGPGTPSATSCAVCHATQRPDLQPGTTAAAMATALGFDHASSGTGECIGCHAATVAAGRYVDYKKPATRALPGGDWKGGVSYPGAALAGSTDQFINVGETKLIRDGTPTNMVSGTTSVTDTIYNGMSHVSPVLPAALSAGPSNAPDNSKCWHCHTNNNGTVTAFRNGQYHAALTSYRPSPNGALAPFAQPTARCADCHGAMTPDGIVEKAGSSLWPMDHAAVFATPVVVAGQTVPGVAQIDCSVCHKSPGATWADGTFHPNVGSAVVSDCVSCHYMLIDDPVLADTQSGTLYAMKHASKQLTFQTCQTCHPAAVGVRALLPATADLWQTGAFHSAVTTQPTACLDCHLVSQPGANSPTQSSRAYTLAAGATATNSAQWMNHGSSLVAGMDCAACHAADAQKTDSVWSTSTFLHRAASGARTCQECHGLTNGGGGVAGTRNNLPAGVTSSTVPTSASAATGVPGGTLSQITHSDVNVSSRDCNACHTQVGVATSAALASREWAQARFHAGMGTAANLTMNGTTGRCSNCHLNVNPRSSYTAFNHAGFSSAPGTQDCSACHSYPGAGTIGSPNWLGAAVAARK